MKTFLITLMALILITNATDSRCFQDCRRKHYAYKLCKKMCSYRFEKGGI